MRSASLRPILSVAAVVWLLIEILRGWTPLLITVFGRAAETPPELIGAFALAVTACPLLLLAATRRRLVSTHTPTIVALSLALLARISLPLLHGRPLLVVASIGVIATLLGLATTVARNGAGLLPGLFTGIALAASTHAVLGTWGAVWRTDIAGALVTTLLVVLTIDTMRRPRRGTSASAPPLSAFLTLLVVLLATLTLANPARALVAHSWGGMVVAVAATTGALLAGRSWPPLARRFAGGLVVLSVAMTMLASTTRDGVPNSLPAWSLLGFAVGMPSLAIVLSPTRAHGSVSPELAPTTLGQSRARTALALAAGAPVFTALLFAFYAGYDLGYRADWLVVLLGLAIVGSTRFGAPRDRATAAPASFAASLTTGAADTVRSAPQTLPLGLLGSAVTLAAVALVAGVGPFLTIQPLPGSTASTAAMSSAEAGTVRVAAWNLRMGYGIDGTFRPRKVAQLLQDQASDVILLSEVDRGWLLNGGQDQLGILARLLDRHQAFGPAGDQVWGDAILSRTPLSSVSASPLPAYDSLTGAQVLSATTTVAGGHALR